MDGFLAIVATLFLVVGLVMLTVDRDTGFYQGLKISSYCNRIEIY